MLLKTIVYPKISLTKVAFLVRCFGFRLRKEISLPSSSHRRSSILIVNLDHKTGSNKISSPAKQKSARIQPLFLRINPESITDDTTLMKLSCRYHSWCQTLSATFKPSFLFNLSLRSMAKNGFEQTKPRCLIWNHSFSNLLD